MNGYGSQNHVQNLKRDISKAEGWWTENCKIDADCGGGNWISTTGLYYHCWTNTKYMHEIYYCGKCKYGWRNFGGSRDWCCSWDDFKNHGDCNCPAYSAGECKSSTGNGNAGND